MYVPTYIRISYIHMYIHMYNIQAYNYVHV